MGAETQSPQLAASRPTAPLEVSRPEPWPDLSLATNSVGAGDMPAAGWPRESWSLANACGLADDKHCSVLSVPDSLSRPLFGFRCQPLHLQRGRSAIDHGQVATPSQRQYRGPPRRHRRRTQDAGYRTGYRVPQDGYRQKHSSEETGRWNNRTRGDWGEWHRGGLLRGRRRFGSRSALCWARWPKLFRSASSTNGSSPLPISA